MVVASRPRNRDCAVCAVGLDAVAFGPSDVSKGWGSGGQWFRNCEVIARGLSWGVDPRSVVGPAQPVDDLRNHLEKRYRLGDQTDGPLRNVLYDPSATIRAATDNVAADRRHADIDSDLIKARPSLEPPIGNEPIAEDSTRIGSVVPLPSRWG